MHRDNPFPHRGRYRIAMSPLKGIFIVGLLLILSIAVMLLWNALMPDLFGFKPVSYAQALGLLVLCRILFGGFQPRGFPGRDPRNGFFKDKWKNMTDEDRQRFREELRRRL